MHSFFSISSAVLTHYASFPVNAHQPARRGRILSGLSKLRRLLSMASWKVKRFSGHAFCSKAAKLEAFVHGSRLKALHSSPHMTRSSVAVFSSTLAADKKPFAKERHNL